MKPEYGPITEKSTGNKGQIERLSAENKGYQKLGPVFRKMFSTKDLPVSMASKRRYHTLPQKWGFGDWRVRQDRELAGGGQIRISGALRAPGKSSPASSKDTWTRGR
jgi:hypothetical protein